MRGVFTGGTRYPANFEADACFLWQMVRTANYPKVSNTQSIEYTSPSHQPSVSPSLPGP